MRHKQTHKEKLIQMIENQSLGSIASFCSERYGKFEISDFDIQINARLLLMVSTFKISEVLTLFFTKTRYVKKQNIYKCCMT